MTRGNRLAVSDLDIGVGRLGHGQRFQHFSRDPGVDEGFGRRILDFDHPKVGVSPTLTLDVSIGVWFGDGRWARRLHPEKFAISPARLGENYTASIAGIEFQQNGAGIVVAAGDDSDRNRSKITAPDQGLDPYSRFQPRFHIGG